MVITERDSELFRELLNSWEEDSRIYIYIYIECLLHCSQKKVPLPYRHL